VTNTPVGKYNVQQELRIPAPSPKCDTSWRDFNAFCDLEKGRRLFSMAAICMLLTAAAHTAGNVLPRRETPTEQKIRAEMRDLHFPLGMGMNPSLQDVYLTLVFTMSITLAALGLISLLIAASPEAPDPLLRAVAWANAVWVGALLALCWRYQVPPPLISAVVIELFTIGALITLPRSQRS
jgi:hypothetical protein